MRYTQIKAFENHLESSAPSHFAKIYVLLCKDLGERLFIYDRLKAALLRQFSKIDIRTYQADPKGERDFLRDLEAPSLFCEEQLFHLAGCEKLSKGFCQSFEKKVQTLFRTTTVFSGESIAPISSFYRFLEKEGVILDTGGEKPWEKEKGLGEWLVSLAKKEKKTIAPEALRLLVKGCGNFSTLFSEWEKLAIFTSGRSEITKDDVERISVLIPEESSWQLGEAILASDGKRALTVARNALSQGSTTIALLRQVRHQFSTALYILSCQERGKKDLIPLKFSYLKGAFLEKQLSLAARFGLRRLSQAVIALEKLEYKAKDTLDDPHLLFTYLIGLVA